MSSSDFAGKKEEHEKQVRKLKKSIAEKHREEEKLPAEETIKELHETAKDFEKMTGFVIRLTDPEILKRKSFLKILRELKYDSEVLRIKVGEDVRNFLEKKSKGEIQEDLLEATEVGEVAEDLSLVVRKLTLGGDDIYTLFIGEARTGAEFIIGGSIPILAIVDLSINTYGDKASLYLKHKLSKIGYKEKVYVDVNRISLPFLYAFLKGFKPEEGVYRPFLEALEVLLTGRAAEIEKRWKKKESWSKWAEEHQGKDEKYYFINAARELIQESGIDLNSKFMDSIISERNRTNFYKDLAKISIAIKEFDEKYEIMGIREKKKQYYSVENIIYNILENYFGMKYPKTYFKRVSKFIYHISERDREVLGLKKKKQLDILLNVAAVSGLIASLLVAGPVVGILAVSGYLALEESRRHSRWLRLFYKKHFK